MKRIKESTWNYIIAALMVILIAYLGMSKARSEELTELEMMEIMIVSCTAAYGVAGQELNNDGYIREGRRWYQFYIGWNNYNEGVTEEKVKAVVDKIYANLGEGQSLNAVTDLTDETCLEIRDWVLEMTDMTHDDWFAGG